METVHTASCVFHDLWQGDAKAICLKQTSIYFIFLNKSETKFNYHTISWFSNETKPDRHKELNFVLTTLLSNIMKIQLF